jgi:hypothetical protein
MDLNINSPDINNTIDNTIAYDNTRFTIQKGKKAVVATSSKSSDQARRNRSMNLSNSFKMSQIKFKNRYDHHTQYQLLQLLL